MLGEPLRVAPNPELTADPHSPSAHPAEFVLPTDQPDMPAAFLSFSEQQSVDSGHHSASFVGSYPDKLISHYDSPQEDGNGQSPTAGGSACSEGNTSGQDSAYRDDSGDVSADSASLYQMEHESSPDSADKLSNSKNTSDREQSYAAMTNSQNRKNEQLSAETGGAIDFVQSMHDRQHIHDRVYTDVKIETDIKSSYSPSSSPELEANRPESIKEQRSNSEDLNALQRLQNALEKNGTFNMYGEENMTAAGAEIYQCHLCSYTGSSKFNFSQHMHTHYDFQCSQCDFKSQSNAELKDHMKIEHNTEVKDFMDEPGVRVPRVNASGKIRMHKCKFCEYKTPTQLEHWDHLKTHIPPEKRFWCHVCPFITDVKHHLTYHLRNHFNSKPFKCNKCEYSCVNKSMLSSHMKSHTNFYQYRCADCSFAAKYANALKNHLRKEKHRPGMVLNPDGSPNPFVIIDVYGTRRGPKIKKDDNGMPILPNSIQENYMNFVQNQCQFINSPTNQATSLTSSFVNPYTQPDTNVESPDNKLPLPRGYIKCDMCPFSTSDREMLTKHMMNHMAPEHQKEPERSPQLPNSTDDSFSQVNSSERMELLRSALAQPARVAAWSSQTAPSPSPVLNYHPQSLSANQFIGGKNGEDSTAEASPSLPQYDPMAAQRLRDYFSRALQTPLLYNLSQVAAGLNEGRTAAPSTALPLPFSLCRNQIPNSTAASASEPASTNRGDRTSSPIQGQSVTPQPMSPSLYGRISDLSHSRPSSPPKLNHCQERLQEQNIQLAELLQGTPNHDRQKQSADTALDLSCLGKRSVCEESGENADVESPQPIAKHRRKGRAQRLEVIAQRLQAGSAWSGPGAESHSEAGSSSPASDRDDREAEDWRAEAHTCQSCGIAFKDLVMYTMHMGFHDFRRPFSCNKCGEECRDAIAFFLHIARVPHTS